MGSALVADGASLLLLISAGSHGLGLSVGGLVRLSVGFGCW